MSRDDPSESFLFLAASILDSLSSFSEVPDAALLQLHAMFGPMLMSALQLVDKREVVRVSLPGGRAVYQVTGSTGLPYTLYVDVPTPYDPSTTTTAAPSTATTIVTDPAESDMERPSTPTPQNRPYEPSIEPRTPTPTRTPSLASNSTPQNPRPPYTPSLSSRVGAGTDTDTGADANIAAAQLTRRLAQHAAARRALVLACEMERMYCPCAGFMFNSLAGEKNYFCKHLLAVVLAHQTGKAVGTEVRFGGVVDLLGLKRS